MTYPKMKPCPQCKSADYLNVYSYEPSGRRYVECDNHDCNYRGPGDSNVRNAIRNHNASLPPQPSTDEIKWAQVELAARSSQDECFLWPFSKTRDGYGQLRQKRRFKLAHREVCRIVHGDQPTPQHEVAHSCGNRGCINPRHLRWATHKENCDDKIGHGTKLLGEQCPCHKLTEAEVLEIRASTLPQAKLAEIYGVSKHQVCRVKTRKSWKELA